MLDHNFCNGVIPGKVATKQTGQNGQMATLPGNNFLFTVHNKMLLKPFLVIDIITL